ncbi:hypothetical protein F511_14769 [Dorcoceras hygrometricum]|uniref:Dystroglycan-like n=1 Tax=Dorcoceras hygrometricum TaxID=472368 RepID=A0A2Z7DGB9_9LAMI|nr:hypothetical protein F511_14769 [Dorcoceras hygrometricum]
MTSSLVSNTKQIHFSSVLSMDNSEMVAMFEALVGSCLNGFLGWSDIFETALIEFHENASVRDGKVVSTVEGTLVEISEDFFAQTLQLPVEGLIDINERELKIEYRILSDIVEKSITMKAGSFDAVTHERFLLMSSIFVGVSVNWGILLYKIFKDVMTPEMRKSRGYAVHICILLKNIPDLELGDSEEFPPLKILIVNTVGRYIAINDKIVVDNVEILAGKSRVKKTPVKRAVSKKRSAVSIDEQVVKKKRTLKGKASHSKANLELVSVALDVEPIQTVDLTSADDVDTIIETVLAESAQLETDVGSPVVQKADEMEQCFNISYEDFFARGAEQLVDTASDSDGATDTVACGTVVEKQPVQRSDEKQKDVEFGASEELVLGKKNGFLSNNPTDEELMSLDDLLMQIYDDMMLPSVTAADVTKIKFGLTVQIHEVQDKDCLSQLIDLESVRVIAAKEKHMLYWAETTSLETAVKRRMYIIVKYIEMLLRKFLESHRKYFSSGQPWTAMSSQIIDLLSATHLKSLDALMVQEKEHGLIKERPCSSNSLDDSADSSGVVLAQFYSLVKSTCWVRRMVLVDGIWTPLQVGSVNPCRDIVVKSSVVDILEKVPTGFFDVLQQGTDINNFVGYFSDSIAMPILQCLPEVESVSSDVSTVYRSPYPQPLSSSSNQLDFHPNCPMDEEFFVGDPDPPPGEAAEE